MSSTNRIQRLAAPLAMILALTAIPGGAAFAQGSNDAIFSTATSQTIFNGGIQTLLHFNVYETPQDLFAPTPPVEQAVPTFLTNVVGLDALQEMRPDDGPIGFVFSTANTGAISVDGRPFILNKGRAYYYNTETDEVSVYEPLDGLRLVNLDALAAMPDGTTDGTRATERLPEDPFLDAPLAWAFSTATVEHVIQDGQTFTMHPGNAYCFNRQTGRIILLAETQALGVTNIDALDAPSRHDGLRPDPVFLAPIAFSPDRTQLIRVGGRLVRLQSNSMYSVIAGPARGPAGQFVETTFDGTIRRLRNLDAFSTPLNREVQTGACVGADECALRDARSCDDDFFPGSTCDDIGCSCPLGGRGGCDVGCFPLEGGSQECFDNDGYLKVCPQD